MHTTCPVTAPMLMWSDLPFQVGRTGACLSEKAAGAPNSQVSAASLQLQFNPAQPPPPFLLQVSDDLHLAQSRQPLFRKAGFSVHTCASAHADCLSQVTLMHFRAAVFCQSVPSKVALELSRVLAGRNQEIRIVRISRRPWQEAEPEAYDLLLQAPLAPGDFISTIARLREQA